MTMPWLRSLCRGVVIFVKTQNFIRSKIHFNTATHHYIPTLEWKRERKIRRSNILKKLKKEKEKQNTNKQKENAN